MLYLYLHIIYKINYKYLKQKKVVNYAHEFVKSSIKVRKLKLDPLLELFKLKFDSIVN